MIPVRLAIQQRVLPNYRTQLFDSLAKECQHGCSVFAGEARAQEMVSSGELKVAQFSRAANTHIFSGSFYLCWQKGLIRWLKKFNPDVAIMEANPRYIHSLHAVNWMKRHDVKIIGWGLGSPSKQNKIESISKGFKKFLIAQYDAMITYSNKGKQEYCSLGYPDDKIFVAPNAVAPRPTEIPVQRPQAYEDGQPTILFVGRLQVRKRVDLLLRACAALKEANPHLWIVGDGPVRAELEKLAREIYPSAEFFGSVYGKDLDKFYLGADLFILPGTGGLAVQQAMAYALPIVVAEADGTQVDLVRQKNGWNVRPGDVKQLTSIIKQALNDPRRLRRMGLESFDIIQNQVNLEMMVDVFTKTISSVLER